MTTTVDIPATRDVIFSPFAGLMPGVQLLAGLVGRLHALGRRHAQDPGAGSEVSDV